MSHSSQPEKYGGTVAIGLDSKTEKYNPTAQTTTTLGSIYNTSHSFDLSKTSLLPIQPPKLLKSFAECKKEEDRGGVIDQYQVVKKYYDFAEKASFSTIKPRILSLICKEINAINVNLDEDTRPTFGDDGDTVLTVEYLDKVSTYEPEVQSEMLDEFGLDSITGFKLGKAVADEFLLPANTLGPHLFLTDPTLDGVANTLTKLIKTNFITVKNEYEKKFGIEFSPDSLPSSSTKRIMGSNLAKDGQFKLPYSSEEYSLPYDDATKHDRTASFVFRGTTELDRIPYILGIGTATPHIGAPQDLVIEAMIEPLKMDEKSNERFRKIGSHSGIGTRYSVLNNLGQIFWGREGANSGNDEFIDIRQQVYKREAVKLSIQSAADAVRDWLGDKVYLTEAQRDAERMEKYKECQKLHNQYEDLTKKLQNNKQKKKKNVEGNDTKNEKNGQNDLNPINDELLLKSQHEAKLKSVKSFAEGDSHVVETTSGNKAEDVKISKLGSEILTKLDRTITHIVAITCTGIIVPGLEFHIMKALGLPESTQRLPITFAGCFGAISGLRTASAIATENPLHRVLVVCTELCTLHMQLSDKIDNLIGSALFADGSGAFIVGCLPTPSEVPIYSIDALSSYVIPNTVQHMAWEATKSGQVIGLAKEISSELFNAFGEVMTDLLQYTPDYKNLGHAINPIDCNLAIHPGGPLIINTIQGGFDLPPIQDSAEISYSHPVAETWKILYEYGNMSSATLVYVLDRLRLQKEKDNKPTPTLAFGPGLSIECSLLHRLEGNPGYKNKK